MMFCRDLQIYRVYSVVKYMLLMETTYKFKSGIKKFIYYFN
jgi:hypothetical protein